MPRILLNHINKELADAIMDDGAPASPITLSNCYRHLPRYQTRLRHYRKVIRKRVQRRLGLTAVKLQAQKPTEMFLRLLTPNNMLSAPMYSPEALDIVLRQLRAGMLDSRYIGRMITLEKAARTMSHL